MTGIHHITAYSTGLSTSRIAGSEKPFMSRRAEK
jgi:hypothetical protein